MCFAPGVVGRDVGRSSVRAQLRGSNGHRAVAMMTRFAEEEHSARFSVELCGCAFGREDVGKRSQCSRNIGGGENCVRPTTYDIRRTATIRCEYVEVTAG